MNRVCVASTKFVKSWTGPQDEGLRSLSVCSLQDAMRATYLTDAHMTTYAPLEAARCHRVKREAMDAYSVPLFVSVFLIDWDTPEHKEWAHPDQAAELIEKWSRIPMFSQAGFFTSLRGARIVQPLAQPIPVADARPYLHRWLDEARIQGVEWDPACRSPLGLWRLPNVRRQNQQGEAVQFVPSVMQLERMQPIELEPLEPREVVPVSNAKRARTRGTVPAQQLEDVGEPWNWRVPVLAKACLEVRENWHQLFLQLAGALLEVGAPPSRLLAICAAISHETGADTKVEDRRASAQTTLHQYCFGGAYAGRNALARDFRGVALALDEALTIRSAADLEQWKGSKVTPPLPTADEAGELVRQRLRALPAGLTLIVAGTGVGKTYQATAVAVERALTPYKSPDAKGLRAPPHSKTVILVDKHSVGKELQTLSGTLGAPAMRLFGPLSAKDEDGNPECIYHEAAKHIVAGGQPMQWVLCEGGGTHQCPKFETCRARLGADGPPNARIVIAPHAMANKVPKASLVVIDERPKLLVTESFTDADLETTLSSLADFATRPAAALRPAVVTFRAMLQRSKGASPIFSPVDVAQTHLDAVEAEDLRFARVSTGVESDDLVAFAQAASVDKDGKRCEVPALRDHAVYAVRGSIATARRLGTASRALTTLLRALSNPDKVSVRVDVSPDGQPTLCITFPNDPLQRVLRESSAVVVLDANAATDAPMYREAVGYTPPIHVLEARDACPVERTHLRAAGLNRTELFRDGVLQITDQLVRSVRDAVSWASERPETGSLGVVAMRQAELALQAAWSPTDASVDQAWAGLGLPPVVLEEARAKLGPVLRAWTGTIEFAHFGDLRGRNDLQHLDALVTLGDPRPNLDDVALELTYGGYDITVNALADLRCAHELEQAHGRLRTVRRTRACRLLHVGKVRPSGRPWESGVLERDLAGGKLARTGTMDAFELLEHITRLGGVRAAARRVGCSHAVLSLGAKGARPVSAEVAGKLRAA